MVAPFCRFIPLHESVEREISAALNTPGLVHIDAHTTVFEADGRYSAKVDYRIHNQSVGIWLVVCSDGSFVLCENWRGPLKTKSWTAEEANPKDVIAAVLAALMTRVTEDAA